MVWIIYLLMLCASSQSANNDDFVTTFRNGLEEYLKTGGYSRRLEDALQIIEFPRLFRKPYSSPRNLEDIICLTCNAGFGVLLAAKRGGISNEIIKKALIMLCVRLNIESEEVCRGFVDIHYETIAYIVDARQNLNSKRMCGIIFQSVGCVDQNRVDWTIDIPEKPQNFKKKRHVQRATPLKILHLTDIHYSADYQVGSNAACEEPLCCRNGSSPSNVTNAAGHWGDYRNCDTPWHVLIGTINQIVTEHRNIDFIYFTGDIVDHKVWDTSVDRNTRAIVDVINLLSGAFRSIPIYPTLGNHETHPVNAFSPSIITGRLSTQWVFDLMRTEWRKWLPSTTQGTISEGGYYTVLVQPGFRIIALNSNVCFSYNWWLLYDDVDPYDQLRWLVLVLFKAERNNEIVHILSHVPTADNTCLQNWSKEFFRIILRFSHIIAAQFNGHTHAKENIIYYEGNDLSNPINVAFNGGSLTPYSDFNPNYVVYDVNRLNFEVMDYEMWIYDISESNLHPNRPMRWFKLYSFTDAYKVDRITPHRMNELVQNMTRDCNLSNQYFRLKFRDAEVSTSKGCNRDCVTENVCYMVTPYYKHVDQCNLLKESLDINYNCNFQ